MRIILRLLCALLIMSVVSCAKKNKEKKAILIFTKTEAYRHESIEKGVEKVSEIARSLNYHVVHSEDANVFTEESLNYFKAVVFLSTTGDVLNEYQQADFERFIQAGGGYLGIHAAADTEYKWPWYGKLVGGYFLSHPNDPNVRDAVIRKVMDHQLTDSIPTEWPRTDEWYDYKEMNPEVSVLLKLDESTYEGGKMGDDHPITWFHEYDGGRAFYTGMGHTSETFDEPLFQKMIREALNYVAGEVKLDYKKVSSFRKPEENRFNKVVLGFNLNEPTELAFLPDGRVIFTERKGDVKLYSLEQDTITVINTIDVLHEEEDGLMGIAVDPDFENNAWVYLYYSPAGEASQNNLSRFKFVKDKLDISTEQVILEVPVQREECCHTGGSMAFDENGNLFLSTGDNTNPFSSDGFGPMDERQGRSAWDAQRSSANTNDLRGKILRIHPEADGTYTIPVGNLFPKGTPETRPEIYVMGLRNPYRISYDPKSGFLYWGDVGPDASENDSLRGPRGYDEINQARKPGFFGWPYFVGDNYAYNDFNFSTGRSGGKYDPKAPINDSPNNAGMEKLPPANPAFIWYPYAASPEFPIVRDGGRNAQAGPVYYTDNYDTAKAYPGYFDKKLIIYDWMRNWILLASMAENGDLLHLEHFVPEMEFSNIIDMEISPEGEIYILEYGTGWFQQNMNARLARIEYNGGNRNPEIFLTHEKIIGKTPLEASISASGSVDPDKDKLQYVWYIGEHRISEGEEFKHVFEEDGLYTVRLVAEDGKGGTSEEEVMVRAGNDPPVVQIKIEGNGTFYWPEREVAYEVTVVDTEDGSTANGTISEERVTVFHDFLERGFDMTSISQGHKQAEAANVGKQLMESSDCLACHKTDGKSIGPSYLDVAKKYKDQPEAITYLGNKIIEGGSGVWGEVAMSAHPGFTPAEAGLIAKYILDLGNAEKPRAPMKGKLITDKHDPKAKEGVYFITATYQDKGNDYGKLEGMEQVILRNPRIKASDYTEVNEIAEYGFPNGNVSLSNIKNGSWVSYENIDLTSVNGLVVGVDLRNNTMAGGTIEIRTSSPDGKLIGKTNVPGEGGKKIIDIPLTEKIDGKQTLYLVFTKKNAGTESLMFLDWIEFQFDSESKPM